MVVLASAFRFSGSVSEPKIVINLKTSELVEQQNEKNIKSTDSKKVVGVSGYGGPYISHDNTQHVSRLDNVLEEGLHMGPDLLGLGAMEVPEDPLGSVVGQHWFSVRLHHEKS
jgi:hypothetical protein